METTTTARIKRRRPLVAVLLSLLAPGLGHVYCGRFGKGLLLYFIGTILGVPGLLGILPMGLGYPIVGMIAIAAGVGIWIYAIENARRTAKRTCSDYVPRDYNRWWVYLILAVLPMPISVGGAFYLREVMLQAFYVPSKSMYPTIRFGERVLANKMTYRREPVRRGDIIVFPNPNKRHQKNIKRVVALPGDTVEMVDNQLIVNARKLETTRVGDSAAGDDTQRAGDIVQELNDSFTYRILLALQADTGTTDDACRKSRNFPKTTVPNGHCFVLGDNRNRSHDSRDYGPVPLRDIVGRVDYIYHPRWVKLRDRRSD